MQYKEILKFECLLASIERYTLKQCEGNFKNQEGQKFPHSAASIIVYQQERSYK